MAATLSGSSYGEFAYFARVTHTRTVGEVVQVKLMMESPAAQVWYSMGEDLGWETVDDEWLGDYKPAPVADEGVQ